MFQDDEHHTTVVMPAIPAERLLETERRVLESALAGAEDCPANPRDGYGAPMTLLRRFVDSPMGPFVVPEGEGARMRQACVERDFPVLEKRPDWVRFLHERLLYGDHADGVVRFPPMDGRYTVAAVLQGVLQRIRDEDGDDGEGPYRFTVYTNDGQQDAVSGPQPNDPCVVRIRADWIDRLSFDLADALIDAAEGVVKSWETGSLAARVQQLSAVLKAVGGSDTLRDGGSAVYG